MKISMIGPVYPFRGGISHYVTALGLALERGGHQLQVVSFRRQYPSLLYPGRTDKDPSAPPVRLGAEYLVDPLYPWTWLQAAKAILRDQPGLALIHWWTTFWAPAYAGIAYQLRQSIPVVYLIHNVLPHESKPWDRWLASLALSQGRAFIVQASHERQRLTDLVPHAAVRVCHHPVYGRFNAEPISKQDARRRLGLPVDRPLLLCFGIVRPYKGLKYLLEALAHVGRPLHLVVAGEFWEDAASYHRQIERLGLSENVTVMDRYIPDEEAHLLFSAADALVAPYVGGTQSGAVERALGYGLPAVTTDRIAAGIPAAHAGKLLVVPAADTGALAEAIDKISKAMPARGRAQPIEDDWVRMVRTIEQIGADIGRAEP